MILKRGIIIFWYLVNNSRKIKQKIVSPVRIDENTVLTDIKDVKLAWEEYFSNMFSSKNHSYANENTIDVKSNVMQKWSENGHYKKNCSFTCREISVCISELGCKKATGFDEISAEHLKYGGKMLHNCIMVIMNSMLYCERIPNSFKKGIIIPIPKKDKDSSVRENNRGITLLPTMYKLYQNLLKNDIVRIIKLINYSVQEDQGLHANMPRCY